MTKTFSVPYLDIYRAHKKILPDLKKNFDKVISSGNIVLGQSLLDFEENYAKYSKVK